MPPSVHPYTGAYASAHRFPVPPAAITAAFAAFHGRSAITAIPATLGLCEVTGCVNAVTEANYCLLRTGDGELRVVCEECHTKASAEPVGDGPCGECYFDPFAAVGEPTGAPCPFHAAAALAHAAHCVDLQEAA